MKQKYLRGKMNKVNEFLRYRDVIGEEEATRLFLRKQPKKIINNGGGISPADLFTQAEPKTDLGMARKIDAFYSEPVQKSLPRRQAQVYEAIKILGVANDNMISEATGLPTSTVIPRRKELMKIGMVEAISDEIVSKYSGIIVTHYRATNHSN